LICALAAAVSVGRASCPVRVAPRAGESASDRPSVPLAETLAPPATTNQTARVFHHIPRESQRFSPCQKSNPVWWFKNADDPVPPPDYRKDKCCRRFMWYMRNPFHNLDHYVIGIGDKPFTRVGRFPDKNANPNGGWNWAVCKHKCLRLPFVDYQRGGFEFYCGWRNGGNFGMKLNFAQKRATKPANG
jgi:hypothetical protein